MSNAIIRRVTPDDAESILEIYTYYVENTAISLECIPPTLEVFRKKIEDAIAKYPYFCVEEDGKILGYSYAHPFVGRSAYNWSAELTIYLRPEEKKKGYGKALYTEIEKGLKKMGITNMYACIAKTDNEDGNLTNNSRDFHQHYGFKIVGEFKSCAYKFGTWYDMIWMEKIIGEHKAENPPVIPFPECE